MAEPDVRVDPAQITAVGAELDRVGDRAAAAARTAGPAITPSAAWAPGFTSVAAGALLGSAGLDVVRAAAAEAAACAGAMRAGAAAWTATEDAIVAALRDG